MAQVAQCPGLNEEIKCPIELCPAAFPCFCSSEKVACSIQMTSSSSVGFFSQQRKFNLDCNQEGQARFKTAQELCFQASIFSGTRDFSTQEVPGRGRASIPIGDALKKEIFPRDLTSTFYPVFNLWAHWVCFPFPGAG